ncbi:MAG: hypothetical protein K0S47_570 [Herbinix sp.]|jgi:hypothetical protein|nr:hypothetical protein [Herbinix sp.]
MGKGYDLKANLVVDEVTRGSENSFFDLRMQFSKEDGLDKEKLKKLMDAIIDLSLGDNITDKAEVYPAYLE